MFCNALPPSPRVARDYRLTPSQLRIWFTLSASPDWIGCTHRSIAEQLGIDPKHAGRSLRALVRAGYVERTRIRGEHYRFAYHVPTPLGVPA